MLQSLQVVVVLYLVVLLLVIVAHNVLVVAAAHIKIEVNPHTKLKVNLLHNQLSCTFIVMKMIKDVRTRGVTVDTNSLKDTLGLHNAQYIFLLLLSSSLA